MRCFLAALARVSSCTCDMPSRLEHPNLLRDCGDVVNVMGGSQLGASDMAASDSECY